MIRTSIVVNNKSRNDIADVYLNTSSGHMINVGSGQLTENGALLQDYENQFDKA